MLCSLLQLFALVSLSPDISATTQAKMHLGRALEQGQDLSLIHPSGLGRALAPSTSGSELISSGRAPSIWGSVGLGRPSLTAGTVPTFGDKSMFR